MAATGGLPTAARDADSSLSRRRSPASRRSAHRCSAPPGYPDVAPPHAAALLRLPYGPVTTGGVIADDVELVQDAR